MTQKAKQFVGSLPTRSIEEIAKIHGITVEQAKAKQSELRQNLIDALSGNVTPSLIKAVTELDAKGGAQ